MQASQSAVECLNDFNAYPTGSASHACSQLSTESQNLPFARAD